MLSGLVCALFLQSTFVTEELADGGRLEYAVQAPGSSVRHGEYRRFDAAGERIVLGEYEDGLRTGRWRFYHANGRPWAIGEYELGSRTGEWTFRTADKESIAEGEYEEGLPTGDWGFADAWSDSDGTYTPYHDTWGTLRIDVRGTWVDGRRHGRWTARWPDGTPLLAGAYDRDQRVGAWSFRHADGTFDPEFLSREHEAEVPLPALVYDDPYPEPGAAPPERPTTVDGPLDPSRVPALAAPDDPTRALVERWLGADGADRAAVRDELLGLGVAALPAVIDGLCDLDPSTAEGRAQATAVLDELVTALFRGHSPRDGEEDDEAALRLAMLRAHSAFVLTRDDALWWSFDLPRLTPPEGGGVSPTLLAPPLFLEQPHRTSRGGKFGGRRGRTTRGGPVNETVLTRGLEWLAEAQEADGRWRSGAEGSPYRGYHDEGVTALALLALTEEGSHLAGGPYREHVTRGLTWLLSRQDRESGGFWLPYEGVDDGGRRFLVEVEHRMYDHAIATLALCRLQRAMPTVALRRASQMAVSFALRSRNPYGAWRYDSPPIGENDTLVTAWMVKALKEAERAGLDVDREAYHGALAWIDEVSDPGNGRIGYDSMGSVSARIVGMNDHVPPDIGEPNTAAGLLCRFLLGQRPDETRIMEKHAELIRTKLPEWDPDGRVDMYFWYYGTYAMFQMGGKRFWKPWSEALEHALTSSQRKDGEMAGSWDPIGPWGFLGGRVYATALMCRCLQVRTSAPLGDGDQR